MVGIYQKLKDNGSFHNIGASALTNFFTEGTWHIHIKDLNCTGNESSVWDCPMNELTDHSCYHYDDASVICQCTYILAHYTIIYYTIIIKGQM